MGQLTKRTHAVLALVAALAVAPAIAPAAAGAKKKKKAKLVRIQTATQSASAQAGTSTLTATATCPPNTVVISGGYASQPISNDTFVFPFESRRAAANQWRVSMLAIVDAGLTQPLTVEAYCAKLSGKVVEGDTTAALPSPNRSPATATAPCPSKSRLLSGGFQVFGATTQDSFGLVFESAASGNAWRASVVRAGDDGPEAILVSAAYCLQPKKPKKAKKKKAKRKDPQSLRAVTLAAPLEGDANKSFARPVLPACPKGTQQISGGFSTAQPVPMQAVPIFYESRRGAASWTLGAQNAADFPGSITSFGYCG